MGLIQNVTKLIALDLSNNMFTGDLPRFNVSEWDNLTYFSIKNNYFTEQSFGDWFAKHIMTLQNIKIALFDNNPYMSGEFPNTLDFKKSKHSLLVITR